ncbi:MAG: ImmA/IrrE family metallo-endopeptidase [Candidatus Dadabacteria bacterium]|nr:ImmA/IrrE family metallo-endopeptidase [Candidatus Dadabacteria bacterium]
MTEPKSYAVSILQKFKINFVPVPVEDIAKGLGAKVVFSALEDSHCGMIHMQGNIIVIGVNSIHPKNRQRFTIAHEIGHLVMHKDEISESIHIDQAFGERLNRDGRSSLGEDLKEVQANRFAAELLMPTSILKRETKNQRIDIEDSEFIEKLAQKFQVSFQSMSIKLLDTFYKNYSLSTSKLHP